MMEAACTIVLVNQNNFEPLCHLRYFQSTLLLQIPPHITTVIHLLHINHFFIFFRAVWLQRNLMKVEAKISLMKFPRLTVYQISLSI